MVCVRLRAQSPVSCEAVGSNRVHILTPPAPNALLTGASTVTSQVLTGANGAVPCQNTSTTNGAWGRFVEAPACRSFIWCDSISGPVRAWRLNDM